MKDMKNNKTAAFFLGLILVGSALSCKMFGGGDSSSAGENAVDCPTAMLTVNDLTGNTGQTFENLRKYAGCTVRFEGELRKVESKAVQLADPATYTSVIECTGDFSSDTYRQIGYKLDAFKEKSPGAALPVATFSAKVVRSSSYGYELGNCRLIDYGK